jgi:YMGG-like Gly-zipper
MMTKPTWLAWLALGALGLALPGLAAAQAFVYPQRGQSQQQQDADRGQCHVWATQQTGFDPARARAGTAPPPPPPQQVVGSGAMARGAAGGAAIGAVGGAIGGDAGKGAAIGAASGALIGGMRRSRQIQAEQEAYQSQAAQQQSSLAQGQANYDRAFAACMTGRGYTVG